MPKENKGSGEARSTTFNIFMDREHNNLIES
jgi:hypothetical protein